MQSLSDLSPGEEAVIDKISVSGNMRRRLQDLGLGIGSKIKCVSISPSGNPKAYLIRGAVIAIRLEDGKKIILK